MNEVRETVVEQRTPGWLAPVAVLGLVLGLGALIFALVVQNKLTTTEQQVAEANKINASLQEKLEDTNARLKAQGQALGQSMGLTQKQLEDKSEQLLAAQKANSAVTQKLAHDQEQTAKEVGAVKTDVTAVKTDVGGVKNDVATTQADLANTKTQLTRVVGDQGVMSGLIATNHDELEELKRLNQRNYYEFTLQKGGPLQLVGTIKLQLKKVDAKKSKFTLNVSSDDKIIEKKDKNLDEPIQFYSGKSPMLYEIVVNSVGKNSVSGYLSTPKNAPTPMNVP
ncbi:hypothetical protein ACFQBQ_05670 [Granulicella cerasi]|uniref:Uncharacterized protein n=1 Tax=Granulicella cerasi TaxID=741063 RepID=A0ABW1Z857_9BACT|nr:hypothetical protein [Granulicella cerasi]